VPESVLRTLPGVAASVFPWRLLKTGYDTCDADSRSARRRLNLLSVRPYEVRFDSLEAIYEFHERARSLVSDLSRKTEDFWRETIDFQTRRAGALSAPGRALFVHLLMHSIRHYAQLATLVRQHGIELGLPMDYLFMEAASTQTAQMPECS